jgi:hypothetical protein
MARSAPPHPDRAMSDGITQSHAPTPLLRRFSLNARPAFWPSPGLGALTGIFIKIVDNARIGLPSFLHLFRVPNLKISSYHVCFSPSPASLSLNMLHLRALASLTTVFI